MKILLDTDIGSDIDDAVCLAYLLAHPDCELLGITTVTGDTQQRAMLASALCRVAGRSVPIRPGAPEPLLVPQKQPDVPQAAALGSWPHDHTFPGGEAVELLRHTIRSHPGEVTLLAVGPLTNIALLFASDPEIASLLGGLMLMCGVFTGPGGPGAREWNAQLDPHATSMVFRAAPPVHRSVGLDVTTRVSLPAPEVRQRFQHPLLRPVLDFAEVWFTSRERITFHDPLAAVALWQPDLCSWTRGSVHVETASQELGGLTLFEGDPTGRHEVALDVDAERFFEAYFEPFGAS